MAGDPLTDERAFTLLAALPDEISALGQKYILMSISAGDVATGLNGADSSDWTGKAADTYRRWVTKLPGDLTLLSNAYSEASDALDTYGMDVGLQQPRFRRYAGELRTARASLTTEQHTMTQTASQAKTIADANLPLSAEGIYSNPADKRRYDALVTAHSRAWSQVGSLQTQVAHLERLCFDTLDDFDDSCSRIKGKLRDAIEHFPTPEEKLPTPAAGRYLEALFSSIGDSFKNLIPDAEAWAKDPKDLSKLAKFAEDFGTVAASIGTAAAIAAFPADGPVAAALEALAEGGDTAFDASLGLKTGADLGRLAEGDSDYGAIISDEATIALDGVGKIKAHDPEAAVEATKGEYDAASSLQSALGDGPVTAASIHDALLDIPVGDKITLQRSGIDLANPKEVQAYIGIAIGAGKDAKSEAKAISAINASIQYGGGDIAGTSGHTADGD